MYIFCKKCWGIFLAVFLTVGFCMPSFAEETQIYYSSYVDDWPYQQLKDAKNWTEEQWDAFIEKLEYTTNWTDEEWDFYYSFDIKEEILTEEQKAEYFDLTKEISELYSEKWNEFYKKRIGAPNLNGKNILLNETFLNMDENDLIVKDETPFLSLSCFEKLGAEVSFAEETGEIRINFEDVQAVFHIGERSGIVKEKNKNNSDIYLLPPWKNENSVYICNYVLDDMGYDTEWDYSLELLAITNKKEIVSQINENFTILNRLLNRQQLKDDTTQETKGTISMIFSLYGENKNDEASIDTNFEVVQKGESFWLKGNTKLNINMLKQLFANTYFSFPEELTNIKSIPIEMIYNAQTNLLYVKSDLIDEENAWLCLDDAEDEFFFLKEFTIGGILFDFVQENSYFYDRLIENNINQYEKITKKFELILGDQNFTKNKKGEETTYTFHLNKENVKKFIDSIKSENEYPSYYIDDFIKQIFIKNTDLISNADCEISFKEKNGIVQETHMNIYSKLNNSVIPVKISMEYNSDEKKETFLLEYKGQYIGKITVTMNADKTTTNRKKEFIPPKGAKINRY